MTATTTDTPAAAYDYAAQRINELTVGKPVSQYGDGITATTWEDWPAIVEVSLERETVTIIAYDMYAGNCLVQASIHAPTRGAVDSVLNRLCERARWML